MSEPLSDITLGILGGGQLGRMSALAAARLGIDVIIYCPEEDTPASKVVKSVIVAPYDDQDALKKFAQSVNFISYEFENIPLETIDILERFKSGVVRPSRALLEISQDRIVEKTFLNSLGINTTFWKNINDIDDIKKTLEANEIEGFVIKTARFGYDGKGQIKSSSSEMESDAQLKKFMLDHEKTPLILEKLVSFDCEISVIISQNSKGETALYGPMLNEHKDHILHKTFIPSGQSQNVETDACEIAKKIAREVGLIGVLTVEFFVDQNGDLLVNEIAPRTHNSGHWSIDTCTASQFENHVRAVCDLPLGSPTPHFRNTMLNLIGDDILETNNYMSQKNAYVHLYGKKESRKGRKMGHVTFIHEPYSKKGK